MNSTVDNDIKKYTTFKIGGRAKALHLPKNKDEFLELLQSSEVQPIILGGGSNVLVSSIGVEEDVIITSKLVDFSFADNIVTVSCGTKAQKLSREAQLRGLSGFEFMIGIPGTLGGLVYMNAGAHNQSVSEHFVSAEIFDLETQKIITLNKDEMNFSYRHSVLREKSYVLLSAKFELKSEAQEKIDNIVQRNIDFRKQHQPSLAEPNAGSVFKNPQNDSAGRLLDLAGVKSLSSGGACVYEKHANFIINKNNATSEDVSQLMLNMRSLVQTKYNICLKPEIKFIGIKSEKEQRIWAELLSN